MNVKNKIVIKNIIIFFYCCVVYVYSYKCKLLDIMDEGI